MVARRKAVRRITAEKKECLNRLSAILYNFLPLSANSKKAVTYNSIFAESKIAHYLDGQANKSLALQRGMERLFRYHKKLPKNIIRKIVPAAIQYRNHKRKPIKPNEIAELSECLFNLGIDMNDELANIKLDSTLPIVTVPPDELKAKLRSHALTQEIGDEPLELFDNGHFNEAVRKAFEIFEDVVKDRAGIEKYGKDLMGNAFSGEKNLDMVSIEPENRQSFIDGYKHLAMGAMAAVRNIFSHGDEKTRSPEECFELLLFANWLFRYLDINEYAEEV